MDSKYADFPGASNSPKQSTNSAKKTYKFNPATGKLELK